jgi:hypothetical protein
MSANVPLPPEPPAIVEQAQNIQEGLNGLGELYRIGNEISGQIDNYPAQGTSQG